MSKLTPHQQGGRKQRKTMIERYGRDCFKRIGKLGGNPILLKIKKDGKE